MLRYPAKNGAKIAFYVAQWPSARLNHWLALLKARAIENDMYVVAANGCRMMETRSTLDIRQLSIQMVRLFKNWAVMKVSSPLM